MPKTAVYLCGLVVSTVLLWTMTIPAWRFPNEIAHFSEVQNYGEQKARIADKNVSAELIESFRRSKPDESPTSWGFHEQYLKELPKELRTTMVLPGAANQPPLYYVLASFLYEQVFRSDVFTRLYASRFISVLLYGLLTVSVWWATSELFKKKIGLRIAVSASVALYPAMMFHMSGVSNAVLYNTLAMLIIAAILPIQRRFLPARNGLVILASAVALWFSYTPVWSLAFLQPRVPSWPSIILVSVGAIGLIGGLILKRKKLSMDEYDEWLLLVFFATIALLAGINLPMFFTLNALIVYGWSLILGKMFNEKLGLLVVIGMLESNVYTLWTRLGEYYNRSDLDRFVIELSQYKPDFAKWPNVTLFISIWTLLLLLFSTSLLKVEKRINTE